MTEIGEIPEDWEVVAFEEAFNRQESLQPKIPKSKFKNKGKFPIIDQGRDLISGYTDNEELLYKGKLPLIIFGDHTLCVKYVDFRFAVGADGTKLLIPNNQGFTPKFLYYALLGKNLKSEGYKRHFSKLRRQPFQRPEISEQQQIAKILSTADEAIQRINDQITQTERLKKGLMQTLLTKGIGHTKFKMTEIGEIPEEWKTEKISNLGEVVTGGTPSTSNNSYWNGDIPWIASGDVHQLYIRKATKFITKEGYDNSNCRLLPIGSVLVALNGQGKTRGLSAILEIEATCNQSLAGVILKQDALDSIFLLYQMLYRYTELRGLSGTGRNGLNLEHIRNFTIRFPPLQEQQKIAHILSTVDNKLGLLRNKKEFLEKLKRGLMGDLLTGKVRVKLSASRSEN
jgi:type I restriction enzyme S subunit